MSKIFPKIYVKFDLKYFHSIIPLSSWFYYCVITKQMNSNKHYITIQYFVFLVISILIPI